MGTHLIQKFRPNPRKDLIFTGICMLLHRLWNAILLGREKNNQSGMAANWSFAFEVVEALVATKPYVWLIISLAFWIAVQVLWCS